MFGAGGGTSSYQDAEVADVIVMWGSNAPATDLAYGDTLALARRTLAIFEPETQDWLLGGTAASVYPGLKRPPR